MTLPLPSAAIRRRLPRAGAVIFGLLLPGCLMFPTGVNKLPYDAEEVAFIRIGVTTRHEVEKVFGKPGVMREGGLLSLYGQARRVAGAAVGAGSGGAIIPVETDHLLVVRYDSGHTVQAFESLRFGTGIRRKELCTAQGLCIKPTFRYTTGKSWMWDYGKSALAGAILFERPQQDTAAKTFATPDNQCALYLYHSESLLGNRDIKVERTGTDSLGLMMDEEGYLHWLVDPGPVGVAVSVLPYLPARGQAEVPVQGEPRFEFQCEAGQRYFIHIDLAEGWFKYVLNIVLADSETGKHAISRRRMMLD